MAVVRLSDAVIPTVYESYGRINTIESSNLWRAGLVANSPLMDAMARSGGITGTMPFWTDIDPTVEPNMSNDDPADLAVPMKIGSATMNYRKSFLNQGWSAMDLVRELAGSDPMRHIKSRTDTYWARQYQRRLLASVKGIIADNLANDSGDMGINLGGATGSAANITPASVISSAFTLGDATDGQVTIVTHSQIVAKWALQNLIVYLPNAQGQLIIPSYLGREIVMDDSLVWSGTGINTIYMILLVGRGFFGYGGAAGHMFSIGEGIPTTPSEVQRIPDAGNGGGQETLWERKTVLLQPLGFNWVEGTLTEFSPTLSDLRLAAHWDRRVERKAVPFSYVLAKANAVDA